ncbi:MAG TPA: hypothetical protein VLM76_05595 [Patescibacteria group bacterium]|nr:hypothetical protein [Patescibacteria group bacterium]
MQDPTQTTETPPAAELVSNVGASPAAVSASRGSRLRTIGRARLGGAIAIGIGALGIAFVAGALGNGAPTVGAIDGSPSGAAPPAAVTAWTAPDAASDVRLDHGGRDGMLGGIGRGNAITITMVNGARLALETDNGWTRTIDATGATVTKDGVTVALATLTVGDRIVFRETRADDGTFTITAIHVVLPTVTGTVASVSGSTVTVSTRDGSTVVVKVSPSTTYRVRGVDAPTLADVKVGDVVVATGTRNADGSLSATVVRSGAAGRLGGVPGDGLGGLRGGHRGGHGWGFPGGPDASPAPSIAPTGSGANG